MVMLARFLVAFLPCYGIAIQLFGHELLMVAGSSINALLRLVGA